MVTKRQEAAAKAKAELSYGQALWYAWGRIDSGEYKGFSLDAFRFAESVKANTLRFELEDTHFLESIQTEWERFAKKEMS